MLCQVWGGARDGTVHAWLSEAAAAEASLAASRRKGGAAADDSAATTAELLRLLRSALGELRGSREQFSALLAQAETAQRHRLIRTATVRLYRAHPPSP